MEGLLDILAIIGLFMLRLAVPAGLTVGVGYLLRRMDARWETEAQGRPEVVQGQVAAKPQRPCWEEKGCTEAKKLKCAASRVTDIPCWLARLRAENKLPSACTDCYRYKGKLAPVPVGAQGAQVPVGRKSQ